MSISRGTARDKSKVLVSYGPLTAVSLSLYTASSLPPVSSQSLAQVSKLQRVQNEAAALGCTRDTPTVFGTRLKQAQVKTYLSAASWTGHPLSSALHVRQRGGRTWDVIDGAGRRRNPTGEV